MFLGVSNFLYPRSRYHGHVNPENIAFNANLQEFSQRVSYLSNLASNGKISLEKATHEIEALWHQLEKSKRSLGVGQNPFSP